MSPDPSHDGMPAPSPSSRRRSFVLVGFAFVVVMLSATLPTPLYPIYQQRYGFSGLTATVVFAAYAVGVIGALTLLGRLSDLIGRRPVLLGGLGFAALSAIVFVLAGGLWGLLAARLLSGIAAGMFTGTATAALLDLVDLVDEPQRERAGLVAASLNMFGLGLGPLLAGLLAQFVRTPLVTPFLVSLGLVLLAVTGVVVSVESHPAVGRFAIRPQRLRVPASARPVFVRASLAGFAGFCVIGLFAAVSPQFLAVVLGVRSHATVGAVVFSLFAASTVGQILTTRISERRALRGGALVLAAGSALVAASLLTASLPMLLAGSVVAGLGQGASFRAGLISVARVSPPHQRAEVSSSFFVICYVAITIPVVGVGAATEAVGPVPAGIALTAGVSLIALATVALLGRRTATDRPPGGPPNP